jgi:3-hydroxyacyl-CoA dehydrogenase
VTARGSSATGSSRSAACRVPAGDDALPAEVDAALEEFGFALGPFAVADLSDLQIGQSLRRRWRGEGRLPARYCDIPDLLCDRGRPGRRTAVGYYGYAADGSRHPDDSVTELIQAESARKRFARRCLDRAEIVGRTVGAMVVEGARAIADGTAAHSDDIDVAMVNGFGFPGYRGGPMWWARQQEPARPAALTAAVARAAGDPDQAGLVRLVLDNG